jgi:hypothetical protein
MTHKETGMQHAFFWDVAVVPDTFQAGLVVAHSRDGVNSDISLLYTYHLTRSHWVPSPQMMGSTQLPDAVRHDVFSAANHRTIDGLVSSMSWAYSGTYTELMVLVKGKSVERINPLNMQVTFSNNELFNFAPDNFNPQLIYWQPRFAQNGGAAMITVLLNDGQPWFYQPSTNDMRFASTVPRGEYEINENVFIPDFVYTTCRSLFFDNRAGKVVGFDGALNRIPYVGLYDLPNPVEASSIFDPNHLAGFDCLFAGYANRVGHNSIWILRNRSTQKIYAYFLETCEKEIDDDWIFVSRGVRIVDLSNCTDIDRATCFAIMAEGSAGRFAPLYYAVDDKIYVCEFIAGNDAPSSRVTFTAEDPGEVFTHMIVPQLSANTLTLIEMMPGIAYGMSNTNSMIAAATWNQTAGEGKTYVLPRAMGADLSPRHMCSINGGFGRITALCQRN